MERHMSIIKDINNITIEQIEKLTFEEWHSLTDVEYRIVKQKKQEHEKLQKALKEKVKDNHNKIEKNIKNACLLIYHEKQEEKRKIIFISDDIKTNKKSKATIVKLCHKIDDSICQRLN